MDWNRVLKVLKELEGVSYPDWVKIKSGVNDYFRAESTKEANCRPRHDNAIREKLFFNNLNEDRVNSVIRTLVVDVNIIQLIIGIFCITIKWGEDRSVFFIPHIR